MTNVRSMGLNQWGEFSVALQKAGFDTALAQEIIQSKNNKLAEAMYAEVLHTKAKGLGFGRAIKEFTLTVPLHYEHDKYIDQFALRMKASMEKCRFDKEFSSANFSKATTKLLPGVTYKVKMFPVEDHIAFNKCIEFMQIQCALMAGVHGLCLVYDLAKENFSNNKFVNCFDEKDALGKDEHGGKGIPVISIFGDEDPGFYVHPISERINGWHEIICFYNQ